MLLELGRLETLVDGPAALEHLTAAYRLLHRPGAARRRARSCCARTAVFAGAARRGDPDRDRGGRRPERRCPTATWPTSGQDLVALARIGAYMHGLVERLRRLEPPRDGSRGDGPGARALAADARLGGAMPGTDRERARRAGPLRAGRRRTLQRTDTGLLWVVAAIVLEMAERATPAAFWEADARPRLPHRRRCSRRWRCTCGAATSQWHRGELREALQSMAHCTEQNELWGAHHVGAALHRRVHGRACCSTAATSRRPARSLELARGRARLGEGVRLYGEVGGRACCSAEGDAADALAALEPYATRCRRWPTRPGGPWRSRPGRRAGRARPPRRGRSRWSREELELARAWGTPRPGRPHPAGARRGRRRPGRAAGGRRAAAERSRRFELARARLALGRLLPPAATPPTRERPARRCRGGRTGRDLRRRRALPRARPACWRAAGSTCRRRRRRRSPLTTAERRIADDGRRRGAAEPDRAGAVRHLRDRADHRRVGLRAARRAAPSTSSARRSRASDAAAPAGLKSIQGRPQSGSATLTPTRCNGAPDDPRVHRPRTHQQRARAPCAACAPAPSTCPATPATTTRACPGTSPSTSDPAAVAYPANAEEVADVVRLAAASSGCGSPRRAPATTPARSATCPTPILLRTSAMTDVSASTPAPGSPASGPACCGSTSSRPRPRTGWPRCTAPPPTSASSATRSAAASAGTPASSGWPPTASPRSSWSPPTASWCAPTPSTTPTCSGRCAAAAAASASSPRWSSGSSRSRRRTPACCCGTRRTPTEVLRGWAPGRRTHPTRSPPRSGCSTCRRCRSCRSSSAAASLVVVDGAVLGRRRRGRGAARAAARAPARRSTPSPGCPRRPGPAAHGPGGPDARRSRATTRARRPARRGASRRSSPPPARLGLVLLVAELRQLGGALGRPARGRRRAADARRRSSCCSASAIAATPEMARPGPGGRDRAGRRAGAVVDGPAVPQLRRGARSTSGRLLRARTGCASRACGPRSTRAGVLRANHPVPRLYEDGRPTA